MFTWATDNWVNMLFVDRPRHHYKLIASCSYQTHIYATNALFFVDAFQDIKERSK